MNSLNVGKMMGHRVGLDPNYYRPIEQELLADYLRAVPVLTINSDQNIENLKEQREQLERLQDEKDRQIEELRREQQKTREMFTSAMDGLAGMLRLFINSTTPADEEGKKKRDDIVVQLRRIGVM